MGNIVMNYGISEEQLLRSLHSTTWTCSVYYTLSYAQLIPNTLLRYLSEQWINASNTMHACCSRPKMEQSQLVTATDASC